MPETACLQDREAWEAWAAARQAEIDAEAAPGRLAALLAAVDGLLQALTYDDSGFMGQGGNGGLISRETIRKADELRIIRHRFRTIR